MVGAMERRSNEAILGSRQQRQKVAEAIVRVLPMRRLRWANVTKSPPETAMRRASKKTSMEMMKMRAMQRVKRTKTSLDQPQSMLRITRVLLHTWSMTNSPYVYATLKHHVSLTYLQMSRIRNAGPPILTSDAEATRIPQNNTPIEMSRYLLLATRISAGQEKQGFYLPPTKKKKKQQIISPRLSCLII